LRDQFGMRQSPVVDLADPVTCRRYGLLNASEVRSLVSSGMTIGAHTMTHPMLSRQKPELAYKEISHSRERLETGIGTRVWAFAYPFGDPQSINSQVITMVQKAGYRAAFVNFGGGLGRKLPDFLLPRIHVTDEMSLAEFEAHISGFHSQLQLSAGQGSEVEKVDGPAQFS
jgi:peptidoglycan/xylan/chitin deacetylase (PgdA/CDA1 family)